MDSEEDRGSTPLASISDFKFLKTGIQLSNEHERKRPCQFLQCLVALAKGSISWRRTATYISLVQFTDKGIHAAKETTQRIAEWATKVQSKGVTIKQMYWTLGHYDQVCVFEAPNDETAASVLLSADILGNIRTQTLRAFTSAEMEKILANIP